MKKNEAIYSEIGIAKKFSWRNAARINAVSLLFLAFSFSPMALTNYESATKRNEIRFILQRPFKFRPTQNISLITINLHFISSEYHTAR